MTFDALLTELVSAGKREPGNSPAITREMWHKAIAASPPAKLSREMFTDILSTLYAAAGVIGNVAYLPTIRDLWHLKPAANLHSYIIWSVTSSVVFTYAAAVNRDRLFMALSGLTLLLCVGVVLLEFRRKRIISRSQGDLPCPHRVTDEMQTSQE